MLLTVEEAAQKLQVSRSLLVATCREHLEIVIEFDVFYAVLREQRGNIDQPVNDADFELTRAVLSYLPEHLARMATVIDYCEIRLS